LFARYHGNQSNEPELFGINKPVFKWTFIDYDSEDQKAFQLLIADDINFENISYDSGEQTTKEQLWEFPMGTGFSELPDGKWYWKVRSKDEDGAWTKYSNIREFTIDTVAPSSAPIIPLNNGCYQSLTMVSGICTDPVEGSGINKVEIVLQRLSDNYYWNGKAWSPYLTWLIVNGTNNWTFDTSNVYWLSGVEYNIRSCATDCTSNMEQPSIGNVFSIDMGKPMSWIRYPIDNVWLNQLDEINGEAEDIDGSGLDKIEISIKRVNDQKCWDSQDKNWVITENWITLDATDMMKWSYNSSKVKWTTGAQYQISSRSTDKASNIEVPAAGVTFNYDAEPPAQLSIIINDDDIFSTKSNVNLSLNAQDIGSNVSLMTLSTDGIKWNPWIPFDSRDSLTLPNGDGEKRIYFRVQDLAGNIAEPVFDTIIFDTTPPEELSIMINDNEKYTNSKIVTLYLNAKDTTAGLGDMALSYDGINWFSWELFKIQRTMSLTSIDGEKSICYKVSDKAGNIAGPIFDSIILDKEPPIWISNSINDGAIETNSTSVTLDLEIIDLYSGVYQLSFSIDNETWNPWVNYTRTTIFTLSGGDGEKTIYIKAKDQAGNIGEPITTTIILNTTSPDIKKETTDKFLSDSNFLNYIILIIIIIVIIIIILIIVFVFSIKSKKRPKQKLLPSTSITMKPGALSRSVIIPMEVTPAPVVTQLPNVPSAKTTPQIGPTITPVSTQVPIPVLPKTTQTPTITTPSPAPRPTPASTSTPIPTILPQLPPAPVPQPQTLPQQQNQLIAQVLTKSQTQAQAQSQHQPQPQIQQPTIETKKTDQT